MSSTAWQIKGDYFETCSCDFLCPCLPSNMAAAPTKGFCNVALVYHIDEGRYGGTSLDGLNFVIVAHTPDIMGKGNWSVGLITDSSANPEQQQALTAIASGQAGGPPATLGPLLGKFLGAESKPIQYVKNGMSRSVAIEGLLDQACEGVKGADGNTPIYLDNVGHPSSTRLALATADRSHLHAFGLNWDDTSGKNNGHFAPFSWKAS
jgi:hypothetical protein